MEKAMNIRPIMELRTINVWEGNYQVFVSNETAHKQLFDENGDFRNEYCEQLDNDIACYVDDDKFATMNDDELEEYCNKEFYDAEDYLDKEFEVDFTNPYTNEKYAISRNVYEKFPCAMNAKTWDDGQMQALANRISEELAQYKYEEELDDNAKNEKDDDFWTEMENCAIEMGMEYYED